MVADSKRQALKEQAKKEEREADERYLIEYLEREEREQAFRKAEIRAERLALSKGQVYQKQA